MSMSVAITDIGIAEPMDTAILKFLRKSQRMAIARSPPDTAFENTVLRTISMNCAWSKSMTISTRSSASVISFISFFILLITCTVFAVLCFCTDIITDSSPLSLEIAVFSFEVSFTCAISESLICAPEGRLIGRFLISSTDLNFETDLMIMSFSP